MTQENIKKKPPSKISNLQFSIGKLCYAVGSFFTGDYALNIDKTGTKINMKNASFTNEPKQGYWYWDEDKEPRFIESDYSYRFSGNNVQLGYEDIGAHIGPLNSETIKQIKERSPEDIEQNGIPLRERATLDAQALSAAKINSSSAETWNEAEEDAHKYWSAMSNIDSNLVDKLIPLAAFFLGFLVTYVAMDGDSVGNIGESASDAAGGALTVDLTPAMDVALQVVSLGLF